MSFIPTLIRENVFPNPHEIADGEASGIVEEVCEKEGKESRFKVGDEVFGVSAFMVYLAGS